MPNSKPVFDAAWDETPVDVTAEANFIWSIANKLRGSYMPDKYGDVIIPMTIIRRFECALETTKQAVVTAFKKNPKSPAKYYYRITHYQFYNTINLSLKELCNDADNIAANFKKYIASFSSNVQDICNELEMGRHIDKMDKDGCLYSVVKAFSELDLSPATFDSIKMGYIFENLIGRFFQNVDAGQYYTGRDIIKMMTAVLMSEGCDDVFDDNKVVTVCDQAAGTGGMLSTAYTYIKHYNPSANVRLFGQEFMGVSYAVGLAEMLIKQQNAENFRHADTFKEDCFPDISMRFVIMNPPFGTPWSGKDAKDGQEDAVRDEHKKGKDGRWGAGLPGGGDGQMLFMQSAIAKLDEKVGRAAIVENGSPLFTGSVSSGESQIRLWLLKNDLVEAIIAMPTDLFYNTGIATYVWIISKNKRKERKGYVQLIDASNIYHKLRKPLGNKKNEFLPEDRAKIVKLYRDFAETELSKIYRNEEFMYREYAVMQPLQRSYGISEARISRLIQSGALSSLWDEGKVAELEAIDRPSVKEERKLKSYRENKPLYDAILEALRAHTTEEKYLNPAIFVPVLRAALTDIQCEPKLIDKIKDGLSEMDKTAEVQRDKKGHVIYDRETRDTEIVKYEEDIETYMQREVLPHVPDAVAFFEEDLTKKNPVIRTGAEIPFTRYFYKYQQPQPSEELAQEFLKLEASLSNIVQTLFC